MESRPVHSIFTPKEVITDVTPQGVTSVTKRVKIHSILESSLAELSWETPDSQPSRSRVRIRLPRQLWAMHVSWLLCSSERTSSSSHPSSVYLCCGHTFTSKPSNNSHVLWQLLRNGEGLGFLVAITGSKCVRGSIMDLHVAQIWFRLLNCSLSLPVSATQRPR